MNIKELRPIDQTGSEHSKKRLLVARKFIKYKLKVAVQDFFWLQLFY